MRVIEYRKKHPHCKFCNHKSYAFNRCTAKEIPIYFNMAKKCPMYLPKTTIYDVKMGEDK